MKYTDDWTKASTIYQYVRFTKYLNWDKTYLEHLKNL